MHPYFYNLSDQLLTPQDKVDLTTYFSGYKDAFYQYKNAEGVHDDNRIYSSFENLTQPAVIKIRKRLLVRTSFVVGLMHQPNIQLIRHMDEKKERSTVIICPLHPIPEFYTPTRFYKLRKDWKVFNDSDLDAICTFPNGVPAIVNTQQVHDLENGNNYRFNLQFCFKESFDEIVNLYLTGKLFKPEI